MDELLLKFEDGFQRKLSPTEIEVLEELSKEYTNEEILDSLKVSIINGAFNFRYVIKVLESSRVKEDLTVNEESLEHNLDFNLFIDKLKSTVSKLIYDTWFSQINYIGADNNIMIFKVPMSVQKTYINDNYINLLTDIIREITNEDYNIQVI